MEEIHQPESVRYEGQLNDKLQVKILLSHETITEDLIPFQRLLFGDGGDYLPWLIDLGDWN